MAHILVVDDTRNIRKMVELTLKQNNHEVETANDGEEGLTKFGDGTTWDLTIVDQQMPKIEGREFIKAARKRDSSTRIIMMTAFATTELAAEIMQAGALDFLRKPFSTETLRGAVDAALSHSKLEDEENAVASVQPLPKPGEKGFVIPRRSYCFNSFTFWALPREIAESSTQKPPGFETGMSFQIRNSDGAMTHCFVGLTEHIRQQLQQDFGADALADETFLTELCSEVLSNHFWKNASPAPEVLTVYELPNRLLTQSRSPHPWGFFTRGR